MRKLISTVLIISGCVLQLHAENISGKLTGTILGTTNCFDYTTNTCSTTINTATNAFDGNLQNTFASCERTGGWVGIDLGLTSIITKISYCPRSGQQGRMLLGVFEGANQRDFGDAIPIFLVSELPAENILSSQTIHCSKGFRYVRYVGPNNVKCNVAEIEFYGYSSNGDNSILTQITNLPTVIIHTSNAQDIIDKDTYIKGIVSVISENGTNFFTDSLEIKGRGNVSWDFPKKPYRMKLNHKASLLGLAAVEKSWTLINNYGDKTLMRNLLAFDLSKRLGMSYTPAGKPVDVFLNGEYKGTYQLCDQIEVTTGRVEVEKMKTSTVELPLLSGGYLLEMDAYANQGISWFNSANKQVPVTIKYPKDDEIVPAQSAYIKSHFEKMEMALFSTNYTDPTNGFRKYIDTDTFLRHFLVGEISGNTDTYWSTYIYKNLSNDKFYFGPVWDFDIAYENDYRTYPINNNPDWIYASKGSAANGMKDLVNRLFTDPSLTSELKATYASYRNSGIITESILLKVINDYALELDKSQKLNFMRWNILNVPVHMNPQALGSFTAEVNNVRNYIKNRLIWMDYKLNYIPGAVIEHQNSSFLLWGTTNRLHMEGFSSNANIRIVDFSGRTILTKQVDTHFTTALKKGIYMVQVSDQIKGSKTMKCIIP